jgi:hypothetical protein
VEHRQLGRSGLRVSALSLGTMTFGGRGNLAAVGSTDVAGAARQIDMCLDAGVDLIDTLAAASLSLSDEERRRLDEVSAPPLPYPHWHQAKTASDRLGAPERSMLDSHLR